LNVGYTSPTYLNGFLQTIVGLTYNGYNGQRYSYTYSDNTDFNGDGYRGNSLLYLPTSDELNNMVFTDIVSGGQVKQTADEQKRLFEEFLSTDNYAKNHRGQYAERNGVLGHWENQIDLHFAENIFVLKERGSKIQFTFDVLNFANMLNKKWGATWNQTYNVSPLKCVGLNNAENGDKIAKFQWNGDTRPSKANIGSRWHAQVGVKLTF
jgi:hypothetical protein